MNDQITGPLTIIAIDVENLKGIKALHLQPNGKPIVTLGGKNGAGKSSTLDAIEMAIGGAKTIPQMPIRQGQVQARVVVDLGEIVVERIIDASGTKLAVRPSGTNSKPIKSPQGVLDALFARICFDPYEFYTLDPAKQDAQLRKLAGIDLADLELVEHQVYEARTATNRALKSVTARYDAAPMHAGLPDKELSVADLNKHMDDARAVIDSHNQARAALEEDAAEIAESEGFIAQQKKQIAELTSQITALVAEQASEEVNLATAREDYKTRQAEVDALIDPELDPIRERIRTAEETNRKIRENAVRAALAAEAQTLRTAADQDTKKLEELDRAKKDRLAAAKFPVSGLGFESFGPTLDGVPLAQASDGQKLRLSVAIGFALNPTVRVLLLRRGSLIDDDHLAIIAEMAAEHGGQCWIERVTSNPDDVDVFIVDGEQQAIAP